MDARHQIFRVRAHFNRDHAFGNQFARAVPDNSDAEIAVGVRFQNQFCESIGILRRRTGRQLTVLSEPRVGLSLGVYLALIGVIIGRLAGPIFQRIRSDSHGGGQLQDCL